MKIFKPDHPATFDDLYTTDAKAEIVDGELVIMSPTGDAPGRAALRVAASLMAYERQRPGGRAYGDNVGFLIDDGPRPRSFSPDACWYTGPRSEGRYLRGAPVFAVEVRSLGDYGPAAERKMAAKRADYFAAGTLVVWDVDVLREGVVRRYHAGEPDEPLVFARGDVADAEPAVPGWRIPVDELFE
jgi:Uma2 family endonuclease